MKKKITLVLLMSLFLFLSCEDSLNWITVNYDSNGGSDVSTQILVKGQTAVKPNSPTKSGFAFIEWYSDIDLLNEYDFSTILDADITLYAKWEDNIGIVGVVSNALIYDSDNTFIGYAIGIYPTNVIIYTSKNYQIVLDWDGCISSNIMGIGAGGAHSVFFSSTDGNGTAYAYNSTTELILGNEVFYHAGTYYIAKTLDELGCVSAVSFDYQSRTDDTDLIVNESNTGKGYELIETTVTTIGFDMIITPPLKIVFE